jgi:phosphoenolpyruvate synthase/pyruvate phosphate dikinase
MASRWPGQRVRLRSSSNTEDLPQFNGAGLYISEGVDAEAADKDLADGIRGVWASLWRLRAYDEREYYNIEQSSVAMAVLIHEAFSSEKANGVAISRDILEPSRGDKFTINAQIGEALVTNPAPGVTSDELTYAITRTPHIERQSVSSLNGGKPVLSDEESYRVACNLAQIHDHFRPLLDPEKKNSWFAMDIEFKFIGPNRQLVIKQARPYSFGREAPMGWCDL